MEQFTKLSDKDRNRLQKKLKADISKGKIFFLTGAILPLMFIAALVITKSLILDPSYLENIQVSQYVIDFILFINNNGFYFTIFAIFYALFTVVRGYLLVKVSREHLLLLDILQKKDVADLTGMNFDIHNELDKHRLTKYLVVADQKTEIDRENQEYKQSLGGRTQPFFLTGTALDFISTMISASLIGSILMEALYTTEMNNWQWVLFFCLGFVIAVLMFIICFYVYFSVKGLPVPLEENGVKKFPPNRLRIFSFFGLIIFLCFDVALILTGVNLLLKKSLDLVSSIQLSAAFLALLIGLLGVALLIKEHRIWKAADGVKKEG